MHLTSTLFAITALLQSSSAYPSNFDWVTEHIKRYDGFSDNLAVRLGSYQAPGPNDSRGPAMSEYH